MFISMTSNGNVTATDPRRLDAGLLFFFYYFCILVILGRFFIQGSGIPAQLETDPDQMAFPIAQIIAATCHCDRQPQFEGFSFPQVGSFIFHQTIFIGSHGFYSSIQIVRTMVSAPEPESQTQPDKGSRWHPTTCCRVTAPPIHSSAGGQDCKQYIKPAICTGGNLRSGAMAHLP